MKNKSIQFQIIDHRKSKSQPQWVSTYLSRIQTYLKPIKMFDQIEQPTIEKIYYATNTIIGELKEIRSHSRQGISPTVKFDAESRVIRLFNSLDTLVVEIIEVVTESKNTIYGYARVSTKKQSLRMQVEELKKFGCNEIAHEKKSGLVDRPDFEKLLHKLTKGDTLVIWKLDRLGRSMFELINIMSHLEAKRVTFAKYMTKIYKGLYSAYNKPCKGIQKYSRVHI